MLAALALCPSTANATDPASEKSLAIRAFTDICLKTAPSFNDAAQAAKAYGISKIDDFGFMKMGATADQSLNVQITSNKECAITTESQGDPTLTQQFIQAVSETTHSTAAPKTPFTAKINNAMFIFEHDRKDGEAYVMLKQND